jgi:hypothetical protein
MDPSDVIFTSIVAERDIEITLFEGTPDTFGRQHMINHHPEMAGKIPAVKRAVESHSICYVDEKHGINYREKIYCLGADEGRPDMFMVVAVDYPTPKKGIIISAWPSKKIKPKEGKLVYVNIKK